MTLLLKLGSCEASSAFPLGSGSYSSHVIIVTQMTRKGHSKEKHAEEKQGREEWNRNLINQPLEAGGVGRDSLPEGAALPSFQEVVLGGRRADWQSAKMENGVLFSLTWKRDPLSSSLKIPCLQVLGVIKHPGSRLHSH